MNLHDAGYYMLQAGEYREAAKMLSEIGHRREALPLLAKADEYEKLAKAARAKLEESDTGPDFPMYTYPAPGKTGIPCPRCGERMEFSLPDPDVGLRDATLNCGCGLSSRVVKIEPENEL